MRELCKPDSIPIDFHEKLNYYAQNGYRVLAMATKNLKIQYKNLFKYERDEFEKSLTFIGFLIMENKLKPITKSIINHL